MDQKDPLVFKVLLVNEMNVVNVVNEEKNAYKLLLQMFEMYWLPIYQFN